MDIQKALTVWEMIDSGKNKNKINTIRNILYIRETLQKENITQKIIFHEAIKQLAPNQKIQETALKSLSHRERALIEYLQKKKATE